ncbi:hypothetical protein DFH08DRAFT_37061 [Mycena albidolilacea]|uniref:F-box domain-containing protein n=1 Tax=Mycena albidolilacea TaxID=1033008 RepID=A0AAD7F6Y3_9AGAR|nr:hypothetical protein DFH08DRAFT_37061 [Mycena albidolilacea]
MSFSTLPPEICGSVCHELKELGGNLAPLCTTSRNFSREAQRILYHSVDLRGREMRAVTSWAYTITEHTHLAERVHALVLPAIESLDMSDNAKFVKALRKCINLKELRGAHGWMLSGFPFRLQKFENLVPWEGGVGDDFWKTQTEIRVLSLPYLPNLPSFENQLPNVIALGTPTLDVLPARPLQRVETRFLTSRDFSPLAQYSQTLTTLSVRGALASVQFSIPDILTSIAVSVPALLHLSIIEHRKMFLPHSPDPPTPIFRKGFRKLKTFVLQVRNIERFWSTESDAPDSTDSNDYEMNHLPDLERLGVDILKACPTLLRAAIGSEVVRGQEMRCVLTRANGGGAIQAEAVTALEFEALDMFWNP